MSMRSIALLLAAVLAAAFAPSGTARPPAAEPRQVPLVAAEHEAAGAAPEATVPQVTRTARAVTAKLDPLRPYRGLATWVDIYDELPWERPVVAVERMHRQGVTTLFVETANFGLDRPIFRPRRLARMIDAAHARDIQVVAWYLPSFANRAKDYRRSMAAIRFTTPSGEGFDGFALDIESDKVRDLAVRNARLDALSRRIRRTVGKHYVLGAIVPEAGAKYWLNFPYRTVDRHYDVFLPMAYYTFRTSGAARVDGWIRRNIRAIRTGTGDGSTPIHIIGGLSMDTSVPELRAFADAAVAKRVTGASLYEFETTTARQWRVLRRLRR